MQVHSELATDNARFISFMSPYFITELFWDNYDDTETQNYIQLWEYSATFNFYCILDRLEVHGAFLLRIFYAAA